MFKPLHKAIAILLTAVLFFRVQIRCAMRLRLAQKLRLTFRMMTWLLLKRESAVF